MSNFFVDMDKKPKMWELEQALTLIRKLDMYVRNYGYHLALGGGVLREGYSYNDLDIYALPLHVKDCLPDAQEVLRCMEYHLKTAHRLPEDIANDAEAYFAESQRIRCHDLYIFEKDGKKIDFFIVRMTEEKDMVK